MESEPGRLGARHQEIGERIAAIRMRIGELQEAQEGKHPVASADNLVEAQHHAAISEAAAQRAVTTSIVAFQRAAQAHDRLAVQHEQAAAAGGSDAHEHDKRAAFHRAAAAADRERAEQAQALLSGRASGSQNDG